MNWRARAPESTQDKLAEVAHFLLLDLAATSARFLFHLSSLTLHCEGAQCERCHTTKSGSLFSFLSFSLW